MHLPELMPFRLTKVFLDLMAPVGVNGIYREALVITMKKIRSRRNVLIDCSEVFVRDPLLDVVLESLICLYSGLNWQRRQIQ